MNRRIMYLDIKKFSEIMLAYKNIGIAFANCLDGGAGAGTTAVEMVPYLEENGKVYAFEPFPGNFRFLEAIDSPKIHFIKKALYCDNAIKDFYVSTTIDKDSAWGRNGKEGYSSAGTLAETLNPKKISRDKEKMYQVSCSPADDEIPSDRKIDFAKLDLQGGELNALRGMKRILMEPYFLWIEFSNQPGLLDYLYENDFIVFETAYLFRGSEPDVASKDFCFLSKGELSSGSAVWSGRRITPWGANFNSDFLSCRSTYSLIQTDIVCVHGSKYDVFNKAISSLGN